MTLQVIQVEPETWAGGLNFAEFAHQPHLIADTFIQLTSGLPPTAGYCLLFHDVPGGDSFFEPYAGHGVAIEELKPASIALPPQVNHRRLLVNSFGWPTLAWNQPETPPNYPAAVKRCQVRLISNDNPYLGYFKIIQIDGDPIDDGQITNAYLRTKFLLEMEIESLRRDAARNAEVFAATLALVNKLIWEGQPNRALAVLCMLLTSQHGSQLNRVMVFVPNGHDELQCAYAAGGDDSAEWNSIRRFVADETPTVGELHTKFGGPTPEGDPLYRELIGQRIHVNDSSRIATVWRQGLTAVPDSELYWSRRSTQFLLNVVDTRGYLWEPIAAKVSHNDPWMISQKQANPNSWIFRSRNQEWFLMPWGSPENPLGLVLFDLAAWTHWDEDDLRPKLAQAKELLSVFSASFGSLPWVLT